MVFVARVGVRHAQTPDKVINAGSPFFRTEVWRVDMRDGN